MESILNAVVNKFGIIWTAGTKLKRIYKLGTPTEVLRRDKLDTTQKLALYFFTIVAALAVEGAIVLANVSVE